MSLDSGMSVCTLTDARKLSGPARIMHEAGFQERVNSRHHRVACSPCPGSSRWLWDAGKKGAACSDVCIMFTDSLFLCVTKWNRS